jgi:phosphoribosylamine---glycine ligase
LNREEQEQKMKVLILGSGGREHALAWAVKRSPRVTEVVCAPGNGGMAQIARCVPVDLKDLDAMVRLAEAEQPGLTIVGPELPLSLGIVDALQRARPARLRPHARRRHARIQQGLRQALSAAPQHSHAQLRRLHHAAEVEKAIEIFHPPIVVKADGLFAGKGVIICPRATPPLEAAQGLFTGALLGEAEQQVVIEEFLEGDEISFLCLSDGKHVTPLVPAQDHKRIGEGDTGPNTGGMGVYSTDTLLDPAMSEWILHHIAEPTVAAWPRRTRPSPACSIAG